MRKKFARRAAAAALLLAAACPSFAQPQVGLSPPCALPDWPPSAIAGAPPTVATWTLARLPREWVPQLCVGWDVRRFSSFAAVVGTFQAPGIEAVLDRIGAISSYKGMRYWSVSDRRLEPLVTDAFSVESSGPSNRRADFTSNEMQVDRDLFFVEHDNRSSEPVIYRIRVLERSADHFVADIANANKVRALLMTLFEPGDLRTSLFIYGSADGTWTCYALSGFHPTGLAALLDKHKSYVNRLIALYGHIAGADDGMLPWAQ
jgi:hypothetical protein